MEELDWSRILGLGGPDASQLPLAVNELAPPPVDTGGPGTGPGTMGGGVLRPPTPPSPANTPQLPLQPPAAVTPTEGTMPQSPPGTGLRGRQGEGGVMEPGAVGAALGAGVPVPRPRPTDLSSQNAGAAGPITLGGPGGPTPFGGAAAGTPADQAKKMQGIAAALKGVAAPPAPAVQKVATPNAPRPTGTIKGGDLQALLLALNAGGVGAPGARPATLGQTLGR